MGIGTLGIGLRPGYDTLGITAPVLLTIFRFMQGIGLGGEWGNAVTWVGEHAFKGRRGFWTSWVQQGVIFGLIAAAGLNWLLSYAGIYGAYGWRLSFIIGGLAALVGLGIRLAMMESPIFRVYFERGLLSKNPVGELLQARWKYILSGIIVWEPNGATFFMYSTFSVSYLTQLGFSRDLAFESVVISAVFMGLLITLFSMLSDYIGRKRVLIVALIAGIPVSAIYPLLLMSKGFWIAILGQTILASVFAAYYAAMAPYLVELFETRYRATATGFICGTGSVIGGGLAPIIATALMAGDPLKWWTIPATLYLYYIPALTILAKIFSETHYGSELKS